MQKNPVFADVKAAAKRLDGVANKTPVMTSRQLDELTGVKFFFKCENLQRMGAFKFRGAYNALAQFDTAQKHAGVVTFSSGNHAQAIALAARILGIKATIVMPTDAPVSKLAATKSYGAQVVFYDRYSEDREAIVNDLVAKYGYTPIPPYDHPDVIAGQGTAARELIEEVGELDALFTPVGGGGLLAGSTLSAHAMSPDCQVFGVEPEAGNDGQQSFRKGSIVTIDAPKTIADGAQTVHLGAYPFAIIKSYVSDMLTASDAELVKTMHFFAERMKLLVEPTGCLGLAGARKMLDRFQGKRVGVVISGGNVDISRFAQLVQIKST